MQGTPIGCQAGRREPYAVRRSLIPYTRYLSLIPSVPAVRRTPNTESRFIFNGKALKINHESTK